MVFRNYEDAKKVLFLVVVDVVLTMRVVGKGVNSMKVVEGHKFAYVLSFIY